MLHLNGLGNTIAMCYTQRYLNSLGNTISICYMERHLKETPLLYHRHLVFMVIKQKFPSVFHLGHFLVSQSDISLVSVLKKHGNYLEKFSSEMCVCVCCIHRSVCMTCMPECMTEQDLGCCSTILYCIPLRVFQTLELGWQTANPSNFLSQLPIPPRLLQRNG